MSLPAQLLFESGKAEISSKFAPAFLSRIAKSISAMPEDTEINVKGFCRRY
jgi:chemotaxis protein MotB